MRVLKKLSCAPKYRFAHAQLKFQKAIKLDKNNVHGSFAELSEDNLACLLEEKDSEYI